MKGTTLLLRQHRHVEQLLDALRGERYYQRELLQEFADEMAAIMAVEEVLFYPAARRALGAVLPAIEEEHAEITESLQRAFAFEDDQALLEKSLAELRTQLRRHFSLEERLVFPNVEASLGADELEHLGVQMDRLRREVIEADGEMLVSPIGKLSRADWYRFADIER